MAMECKGCGLQMTKPAAETRSTGYCKDCRADGTYVAPQPVITTSPASATPVIKMQFTSPTYTASAASIGAASFRVIDTRWKRELKDHELTLGLRALAAAVFNLADSGSFAQANFIIATEIKARIQMEADEEVVAAFKDPYKDNGVVFTKTGKGVYYQYSVELMANFNPLEGLVSKAS